MGGTYINKTYTAVSPSTLDSFLCATTSCLLSSLFIYTVPRREQTKMKRNQTEPRRHETKTTKRNDTKRNGIYSVNCEKTHDDEKMTCT